MVDRACLRASDVATMGSIGAPGFGLEWSPAVCFEQHSNYESAYTSAYVTPIPGVDDPNAEEWPSCGDTPEKTQQAWDEARNYILNKWN